MVFFIRLKLKVFGRVKACVIYWNNDSINSLCIYGIKVFLPIMILVSILDSCLFFILIGNYEFTFPFGHSWNGAAFVFKKL